MPRGGSTEIEIVTVTGDFPAEDYEFTVATSMKSEPFLSGGP